MYWYIEKCDFERKPFESEPHEEQEEVVLSPGLDSFNFIGKRSTDGGEVYTFELEKKTPIFEIEMRWAFSPDEEDDVDEDYVASTAKQIIGLEGSYQMSHYLLSMELPPIPGLLQQEIDEGEYEDIEEAGGSIVEMKDESETGDSDDQIRESDSNDVER